MQYQSHIFDELKLAFSIERLNSYLFHVKCNNNKNDALIAYSWNIELSQSLYPALQILEIALRNSLHKAISSIYKTESWFELSFLYEREKQDVLKAKEKLKKDKKPIESCRLIAELSFGFWTSLFDVRYEHNQILWPKLFKFIFTFLPKGQRTRPFLSRELNRIRFLRNRIFHYEPIWHWRDLPDQHNSIIHLINGLSHPASNYFNILDRFTEIYFSGKLQIRDSLKKISETTNVII